MFRVGDKTFTVKTAVIQSRVEHYTEDDDGFYFEMFWAIYVKAETAEVNGKIWHPSLYVEGVPIAVTDPYKLEFADVPLHGGREAEGTRTLYLDRDDDYVEKLHALFGERRGEQFDVFISGEACDPEDFCQCELRIKTAVQFVGMDVPTDSLEQARSIVSKFANPDAFAVEPTEDGFCFKFPDQS